MLDPSFVISNSLSLSPSLSLSLSLSLFPSIEGTENHFAVSPIVWQCMIYRLGSSSARSFDCPFPLPLPLSLSLLKRHTTQTHTRSQHPDSRTSTASRALALALFTSSADSPMPLPFPTLPSLRRQRPHRSAAQPPGHYRRRRWRRQPVRAVPEEGVHHGPQGGAAGEGAPRQPWAAPTLSRRAAAVFLNTPPSSCSSSQSAPTCSSTSWARWPATVRQSGEMTLEKDAASGNTDPPFNTPPPK